MSDSFQKKGRYMQ